MKEARNHFSIVVVNFGVFAIGSCEEGLVEMFDEQGEEWKIVEQTLPVDIKLASLVVDRKILRL